MKYIFAIIVELMLSINCAGNKSLTTKKQSRPIIPVHWKIEIVADDVTNYPEVKLRAIVRDSSGNFIKNLAPPFGHHEDWQTIWIPLIQKHPKWGEKEIKKTKVIETQFERIDTTSLAKLQQEKKGTRTSTSAISKHNPVSGSRNKSSSQKKLDAGTSKKINGENVCRFGHRRQWIDEW